MKSCKVFQTTKHGGTNGNKVDRDYMLGGHSGKLQQIWLFSCERQLKKNCQILVLVNHLTGWKYALVILYATETVVVPVLYKKLFCYIGLTEQIHADQSAQFELQLITELCQRQKVDKTHTTPYHSQSNGTMEKNNSVRGKSYRAPLLSRSNMSRAFCCCNH